MYVGTLSILASVNMVIILELLLLRLIRMHTCGLETGLLHLFLVMLLNRILL